MDKQRMEQKVKALTASKLKRTRYALHLERQNLRLERIGQLLRLTDSEGLIRSKVTKLKKRIT